MKNNNKPYGLIFIIISTIIMFLILHKNDDLVNLFKIIKIINMKFILSAILFIFIFWLLEAFMIYFLIIKFTNNEKNIKNFWLAVKVTMIGQYYSNITPLATGGQPVQLLVLKDDNISLSNGTAILISKFLLFQVGVTIYSFILALHKMNILFNSHNGASAFVIMGLVLNMVMLTFIILIAFNQQILLKFCEKLFGLLHRLKIIKDVEAVMGKTEKFIWEYKESIGKLNEDYWFTIKMFAITFVQLTVFFSTTFFVYKSLNLTGSTFLDIVCLQAFLYMAVSFIPTPGTAGASEVGFMLLLGPLFPTNIISTALLLWRGISYYFSLIFSGIFSFLVTVIGKKKIYTN